MIQSIDTFDPVKLSLEECKFVLEHAGKPFVAVADDARLYNPEKSGVVPAAVRPVLDRIYELIELDNRRGQPWVGVDAVKEKIQAYLDQQAKWLADKRRFPRAPRFPSMHSFDAKGKPHRGGTGSDSGTVKTYFDKEGNRVDFAMDLIDNRETGGWTPEWAKEKAKNAPNVKGIKHDVENHRLECPICKHTESYKADTASSMNAARGRMSKHLRKDPREVELHRELYTNEFGS